MFFRIMSEILPCCWDTPSFFLRRHLFLVCHSVICPCWLGLRWLFIPSLLMLKVSCAIIPDYSAGKWQATTVQHRVKVVRAMLCFYCLFFFLHQMPTYIWTYLLFCWFIFHFLNTSSLLLFIYILQTKSKPHPCECVCVSSMSLISTWACCLLLRRSGSENKQSSSYLAWAGKVDSAEQAAPGGRGGRAQDWTLVVSSPPPTTKNGVNMDKSRAKANALEKEGSSWQQADLDYPLDSFFTCAVVTKRSLLNACDSQGRSLLLLATWAQEAVLEYLLCGATGGIFKCQEAKESSRCCSWSSYWG